MAQQFSRSRFAAALGLAAALLVSTSVEAATSVTLAWDRTPDTSIAGYIVSYGSRSGSYTNQVDVGNRTQHTLLGIPAGTYFFVVRSYNSDLMTSDPSN